MNASLIVNDLTSELAATSSHDPLAGSRVVSIQQLPKVM